MATDINGQVGPQVVGDGSHTLPRLDRTGSQVTAQGRGEYAEATARGRVFHASSVATGFTHGTALTATGLLTLLNPVGSGFNLELLRCNLVVAAAGTLGIGFMAHTWGGNPLIVPAEAGATVAGGNPSNTGRVAKCYHNVSVTTVPTMLRPSSIHYGAYAAGAGNPVPLFEEVKGDIVIPPGYFWAFEGIGAAGTSPLVVASVTWMEVPA